MNRRHATARLSAPAAGLRADFGQMGWANLYRRYSLTTYSTRWTPEAFILTTVIPGAMIFIVVFAMLYRMLSIEPLRFIRKDLHSKNRNKVMKLPNWKFMKNTNIDFRESSDIGESLKRLFGKTYNGNIGAFGVHDPQTFGILLR